MPPPPPPSAPDSRAAARSRIALAADLPLAEGLALYARVAPHVGYAKVGLSLFVEHGPAAVRAFQERGAQVFLDLKLHDIPNTVELAAARAAALGVAFLTVHASGGDPMLRAAMRGVRAGAQAAGCAPPRVLAVTVLTSFSPPELQAVGLEGGPEAAAARLAALAVGAGVDGLVCSPREVEGLRRSLGPAPYLCTPGIRPEGAARGDQARAETPAYAVKAGADLLVVGRPIYAAPEPLAAARAIAEEVSAG
ncbi:orotidine-5'-phosphate decarboxylase [Aggregicoccus sp. 17bor-14]|uniref:orotidine-5'-phosphate decarboxylase n=1 Tax=Myxococcaceae TaxID=31 RepID=UPI00129C5FB0|nr:MULTISPECIES: orotidine-5'-phosphate decarboxylase [Myxococcaceae]MBF5042561.1 orotidine-5'-phosphate decarboxylase [Simulacricoccus sp. 17bor-14]MRI88330.1 orotidine-5'-phosphate decarboxylase [Aggregicoccus sp. 17bor-14]